MTLPTPSRGLHSRKHMRVIAGQRKTLGRKPDPTYSEVVANPRNAKAVRALRKEFGQSQNT